LILFSDLVSTLFSFLTSAFTDSLTLISILDFSVALTSAFVSIFVSTLAFVSLFVSTFALVSIFA